MAANWLAQGPAARDDRGGALRKNAAIAAPPRSTSAPLPHHLPGSPAPAYNPRPAAPARSTPQSSSTRRTARDDIPSYLVPEAAVLGPAVRR